MRIIAGTAKGTRLRMVPGKHVRPTTDRVRESLFAMIEAHFQQGQVLDLFAGTGALGLEALSRGAERAILVDRSPTSYQTILTNAKLCKLEEKVTTYRRDARAALRLLAKQGQRFTVIFLDPPYLKEILLQILNQLDRGNWLTPQGIVVVEHHSSTVLPTQLTTLKRYRDLVYGDTRITLWKKEETE